MGPPLTGAAEPPQRLHRAAVKRKDLEVGGRGAARGLNLPGVEELNLVQMAGGLCQPWICHKQMLMFQLGVVVGLLFVFFFLLRGS